MMQTMTMTGKYKRKSVAGNLEVRGISRGVGGNSIDTFGTRLLRDSSNDNIGHGDLIPQACIDTLNNALSHYHSDSERSSPLIAEYLEPKNLHWTSNLTGNTTDRSSSNSTVTYDEFDREASLNVQKLFDDIDSTLYESQNSNTKTQLYDECSNWSHSFPHLRILGEQLLPSSEEGFHHTESPSHSITGNHGNNDSRSDLNRSSDSYAYSGSENTDHSNLTVHGSQLRVHKYSSITHSTSTSDFDPEYLTEEIFVLDGYYEDIIAIDSELFDDSIDSKTLTSSRRQRRSQRYPPVTPNASVKDDIVHAVFEPTWHMMTDVMRILLQRYSEHFVITHPMAIGASDDDVGDHDGRQLKLPQIMGQPSMYRPETSMLMMAAGGHRLVSGSVLARPNPYFAPPFSSTDPLGKILHISKMGMSERKERTFLEDGTETPVNMLIGSNMAGASKKAGGARNSSANKRYAKNMRLVPINPDRVRTPNVDDEILRGKSITAVKRLGSPPMNSTKALPPIQPPEPTGHGAASTAALTGGAGQSDVLMDQSRAVGHIITTKRSNRASSAIAEKESRPSFRDRNSILMAETRPSTTHTIYPTDQLNHLNNQRSSTPMDRPSAKLRNEVLLGITGSSLIGPSTVVDEEVENRYEGVHPTGQWAPPPHTATGTYRRNTSKALQSLVR